MKNKVWIIIGLLSLIFSSCFLPEKFTCDIEINKDGTYKYSYKGTVVLYSALEEIANNGKLSPDSESSFEYICGMLKSESNNYNYLGNARAFIEYSDYSDTGNINIGLGDYGQWFTINKQNSIVSFSPVQASLQGNEVLTKAGFKPDGRITITSELPVIKDGGKKVIEKDGKFIIKFSVDEILAEQSFLIAFQGKNDLKFLPEEYDCAIEIKKDGNFTYTYEGTVVINNALEEIAKDGKLGKESEELYKRYCSIFESESFSNYSYIGNARAYIEYGARSDNGLLSIGFGGLGEWFLVVNKNSQMVIFYPTSIFSDNKAIYADGGYSPDGNISITSELPIIRNEGKNVLEKEGKYIISFNISEISTDAPFFIAFQK